MRRSARPPLLRPAGTELSGAEPAFDVQQRPRQFSGARDGERDESAPRLVAARGSLRVIRFFVECAGGADWACSLAWHALLPRNRESSGEPSRVVLRGLFHPT
jgi:hypothetical protein